MKYIYLVLFLISFTVTCIIDHVESRKLRESIVGGEVASPGIYSFTVSIQIAKAHVCGGCIIGEHFILTAAHCVMKDSNTFIQEKIMVVVGALKVMDPNIPVTTMLVHKVYVPIKYKSINFKQLTNNLTSTGIETADIAVLKLYKGLNLDTNRALKKLDLPKKSGDNYPSYDTEKAMVSGYGYELVSYSYNPKTNEKLEKPLLSKHRLKYAEAMVFSRNECKNRFVININEAQICAQIVQRYSSKPEGICTGDSGGPLALGRYVIGIVSFSFPGCDEKAVPAVYTRVSSFITFIKNVMNEVKAADILVKSYSSIPNK